MDNQHVETNPHFLDAEEVTPQQREYIPPALLPSRRDHHDRRSRPPPPRGPLERQPQDQGPRPLGPSPPEHYHDPHQPLHVWVPPPHHEGPQHRQGQQHPQPLGMWAPTSRTQGPAPPTKKPKRSGRSHKPEVVMQPQLQDQHPSASLVRPHPHEQGGETTEHHPSPGSSPVPPPTTKPREKAPFLPRARRTKPLTWLTATFCIIFWLAVIIGGLVVLIVYLVFRPRSPRFEVSTVTLNTAYLDMGYLLNADLNVLVNFTNPNKKVRVDFSYMYLDLFFENTQIATQYIEPFSAARGQSIIAYIHMVTSQVRLSVKETMLLQKQIENNRVMFTVKGRFRARSNFGSVWRYSYWLHGQCSIMVSSPPTGVLRDKRCKTRH